MKRSKNKNVTKTVKNNQGRKEKENKSREKKENKRKYRKMKHPTNNGNKLGFSQSCQTSWGSNEKKIKDKFFFAEMSRIQNLLNLE